MWFFFCFQRGVQDSQTRPGIVYRVTGAAVSRDTTPRHQGADADGHHGYHEKHNTTLTRDFLVRRYL